MKATLNSINDAISGKSESISLDNLRKQLLDLGLIKAMEEGKETKFVSKDRIMTKLKGNGSEI